MQVCSFRVHLPKVHNMHDKKQPVGSVASASSLAGWHLSEERQFLVNTVHAAGPHKLAPNILCPQLCTALHATMTL